MPNFALLVLRLTVGGLLMGHGAQKLFGAFGGHGIGGTSSWLESMGLRPGKPWAALAGLSEFGGGLLTVLGFLNPLGPLAALGAMLMATVKVHGGKPIWVTSGGAELPVTNMAVQTALMAAGPGRFSLDRLLGIRLPRRIAIPGALAIAAVVFAATRASEQASDESEQAAGQELQAEDARRGTEDESGVPPVDVYTGAVPDESGTPIAAMRPEEA